MELVKPPMLELVKFDGNALEWNKFWTRHKSSSHDRPNTNKSWMSNNTVAPLTGKAAATILAGLQFSWEEKYDPIVQLLKETYGEMEKSVDLHIS
ncbi:hypothetical protein HPB48_021662 [Haemaphysalis longicornis]|uniref:Uncharacterized protein n=1 Tax=Haemaphysalis longicornis TaxID=44386 RepID=A0A9J6FCN2_HAELO|nr:hypothetical protein HPB48_021662 [Haemaphysalis longicornis]